MKPTATPCPACKGSGRINSILLCPDCNRTHEPESSEQPNFPMDFAPTSEEAIARATLAVLEAKREGLLEEGNQP